MSRVWVTGDAGLRRAVAARLDSSEVVSELPDAVPDAVVATTGPVADLDAVAGGAYALLAALSEVEERHGAVPRYAVGVVRAEGDATSEAAAAVACTLARYASVHLHDRGVRLNAVVLRRGEASDAADAVAALISGMLDGVRGQVLVLGRVA